MKLSIRNTTTALTVSNVFVWANSIAVRNPDAVPALEARSDGSTYKYGVLTRWCMSIEDSVITWRDK